MSFLTNIVSSESQGTPELTEETWPSLKGSVQMKGSHWAGHISVGGKARTPPVCASSLETSHSCVMLSQMPMSWGFWQSGLPDIRSQRNPVHLLIKLRCLLTVSESRCWLAFPAFPLNLWLLPSHSSPAQGPDFPHLSLLSLYNTPSWSLGSRFLWFLSWSVCRPPFSLDPSRRL